MPRTAEEQRTYNRNWRLKNSDKDAIIQHKTRLKRYGLSPQDYEDKVLNQNNTCAICNKPESQKTKKTKKINRLAIDHNHETGQVRDLLCRRCNIVLGLVKEDVELLFLIRQYLEKWNE